MLICGSFGARWLVIGSFDIFSVCRGWSIDLLCKLGEDRILYLSLNCNGVFNVKKEIDAKVFFIFYVRLLS